MAATDYTEIVGVVNQIDNTCDDKAWDACLALFDETIDVDFTSLAGGEPARIPATALTDGWKAGLHARKQSFHLRGNHHVGIDGDTASVISKGYAYNRLDEDLGGGMWEVWGIYRHTLRRTPDGWKCTGMTLEVRTTRGDDAVRTHTLGA
jgi:hypothetical protein